MILANPSWFIEPDSEIDWMIRNQLKRATDGSTFRNINIYDKESSAIAKQRRTLFDYEWPRFTREEFSVQMPAINANNFYLAHPIEMIQNTTQSDRLTDEDPNEHLLWFLADVCDIQGEWSLKQHD